ncbi:leucine-rich repeat-containing protein 41-like [Chanos chanos]|uniref:Leucine-rich repeat-containing protein 41 n=1 Tax=Chanos chanos TaxID=29144 RepID=A0A6J2WU51_CHACN|nr:leucine-rich repeat-containing protein 41-like [Chanos chanos]
MDMSRIPTLVQMCIKYVSEHMDALESQACDLPASLLKDILPFLNIFYLDRIESVAQHKGICTSSVWAAIFRDLDPIWHCRSKPDQDWKQKCLERLFHTVMFTYWRHGKSYLSNLSEHSILLMTVKYVQTLSLMGASRNVCRLASQEMQPVLSVLEKGVKCLQLQDAVPLLKQGRTHMIYVVHRLLDHGSVREVVLRSCPDPFLLTWITPRCGGPQNAELSDPLFQMHSSSGEGRCLSLAEWSSSAQSCLASESHSSEHGFSDFRLCFMNEEKPSTYKQRWISLTSMTEGSDAENPSSSFGTPAWQRRGDRCRCNQLAPWCSPASQCPKGQIHSLDFEVSKCEILHSVSRFLPLWVCLRSLNLHIDWLIKDNEMMVLIDSLRQLFRNPSCSLTDLSVSPISEHSPVVLLMNACPTLRCLSLKICLPVQDTKIRWKPGPKAPTDTLFSLERLSVKSGSFPLDLHSFLAVLKRSPKLSSLHLTGIHQASLLLLTLSESNRLLKVLKLEDTNLADCQQEICNLLQRSMLEELSLRDCRLLDKCAEKEGFLKPFVSALKGLPFLRSLSLSQNRIAKHVIELAELFTGNSPSNITKLDLSSNFILPADLLEFGKLIETCRPSRRLSLDLRLNPLDRDPGVKGQALRKLLPYCNIISDN